MMVCDLSIAYNDVTRDVKDVFNYNKCNVHQLAFEAVTYPMSNRGFYCLTCNINKSVVKTTSLKS